MAERYYQTKVEQRNLAEPDNEQRVFILSPVVDEKQLEVLSTPPGFYEGYFCNPIGSFKSRSYEIFAARSKLVDAPGDIVCIWD